MYKSKLQNLCEIRQWKLPEYKSTKDGPDHVPRFTATVTVNDISFSTTDYSFELKVAENKAAAIAFEYWTRAQPLLPVAQMGPAPNSPYSFVLASGSRIKEALEISSSILQAVIAGELSIIATSNSDLLVPVEHAVRSAGSNGHSPPSLEIENGAKRICLRSSDQVNGVNNDRVSDEHGSG